MKNRRWLRRLTELNRALQQVPLSAYAAEAAFFMLLSVFPLAMALGGVLRRLPDPEEWTQSLQWLLPAEVATLLRTAWQDALSASPGVISLSALGALFAASQGIFALTRGLNAVLGLKENRPWLLLRLCAVGQTVLLTGGLLLLLLGLSAVTHPTPTPAVLRILRLAALTAGGFVLLWLVIGVLYTALPARHSRFSEQKRGAALAAAGWLIYSAGFAFYADRLTDYSRIYGSLSTAAVCMLWLYACMYLLLLGARLNRLPAADP